MIVWFLEFKVNNNVVTAGKLKFEHIEGNEYAVFDIKNPTGQEKNCSFIIKTLIGEYSLNNQIMPKNSDSNIKMHIGAPSGKSNANLIYSCI
ncbi:hypothetical protein HYU09_02605 [Candidatus Woesearchaeota archaeon]|nr:hypothetical protein [Candidatus Woesearchaeota archaeon]